MENNEKTVGKATESKARNEEYLGRIITMLKKLEARGVVKRVPDEVDRKIAYIELSDTALTYYNEEKGVCCDFVGEIIEKMGVEKLNKLMELSDLFIDTIVDLRK